jgi:hypothetical protein
MPRAADFIESCNARARAREGMRTLSETGPTRRALTADGRLCLHTWPSPEVLALPDDRVRDGAQRRWRDSTLDLRDGLSVIEVF